jgi:hypothetical protein
MSGQNPPKPPPRKRPDRKELPTSFLPEQNGRARTAYICMLCGFIPAVGLIAGPLAAIFGYLGYRAAKREFDGNGLGHAFVSMLLGPLEAITNVVGWYLVALGLGWL